MSIFKLTGAGLVLSTASMLMANVASAATIGYWRFEGSNGQAITTATSEVNNDDLAASNTGNSTYSQDVVSPFIYDPIDKITYADKGSMLSAAGGLGYVQTATSTLFNGGNFTMEAFVKITKPDGGAMTNSLWSDYTDAIRSNGWRLGTNTNGQFRYRFDTSATGGNNQGTSIPGRPFNDGQWHHIALTYDQASAELTMYVDGTSATWALVGEFNASAYLRIGVNQDTVSDYTNNNWYFDEVRYTNTVLSPDQFLRAVPEPAGLSMLAAAGSWIWLLRRRRNPERQSLG